jgi:hypothetical protein
MKKILGLTMLTMLMVCCEVGPRQASAGSSTFIDKPVYEGIYSTSYEKSGMEYRIFSMYNGGMCVVNVTKDKLEVELLKKQINEIDKRDTL